MFCVSNCIIEGFELFVQLGGAFVVLPHQVDQRGRENFNGVVKVEHWYLVYLLARRHHGARH